MCLRRNVRKGHLGLFERKDAVNNGARRLGISSDQLVHVMEPELQVEQLRR
jgi:hypothetical protein